jgi:glycosyltransferase involved in cell wall biosynthesis
MATQTHNPNMTADVGADDHLMALEGLSIVIPAYNEEKGIGPTLSELKDELRKLNLDVPLEVIIVNDGSKDRTAELIEPYLDDLLRMVSHTRNQGYGAALKTGIEAARYSWILITDADGTYPNVHIPEVLESRHDFDMIVGARIGAKIHIPLIRRPPKWALRKLAEVLSQNEIPDLNSGFRLMRRDVVRRFYNILPNGFSFTTTITLAMFSAGFRVKYVPINYNKREGSSKIRPIYDTINFTKLIIRTIMYFDPLRIFLPIAVLFMGGAFAVGLGTYLFGERIWDTTVVLLFVTGFQMLVLGMLADTMNRRLP